MDWMRENKLLAAIVGFSLAGAVALAVILFMSYASFGETLNNFDNVNGSLARLKGEKLAPTPENLEAKRKSVDDYRSAVDKLSVVLYGLQKEDSPISETDFQAKLKARIVDVKKQASDRRIGLPAEFNLAFDKYTSTLPKSASVASELSNYLDAVNELSKMFIASGIASIDVLERSDLTSESDAPPPAAPKPTRAPAPRPGARPNAAAANAAAAQPVETIVEKRQVRAIVTLDQAALQNIVNKLASPSEMPELPFFAVLRLLRIENSKQEGPLKSEVNLAAAPAVGAQQPAAGGVLPGPGGAPAANATVKPATPDSVAVLGKELLRAYLEIDLVKFIKPAETAATK